MIHLRLVVTWHSVKTTLGTFGKFGAEFGISVPH